MINEKRKKYLEGMARWTVEAHIRDPGCHTFTVGEAYSEEELEFLETSKVRIMKELQPNV